MTVCLGTITTRNMRLKHSLHSARAWEEQAQKKALASTLPFSASVRLANIRGLISWSFYAQERKISMCSLRKVPVYQRGQASRAGCPNEGDAFTSIPELEEEFWHKAAGVWPVKRRPITLRVDEDGLAWCKEQRAPYQTKMNAVLRAYVQAYKRRDKHA